VPDTADNTEVQAAGQPDAMTETADDAAAQQALADAIASPEPDRTQGGGAQDDPKPDQQADPSAKGDPWADPDAARKEIEKLRKEAANWRTKYRDAEPQLSEYQKYLDSQKTEQQRLADAKEAAEKELSGLRAANARLMAAATHEIPADLIDDLGDGTEEQIDARAQRLAELLKAAEERGRASAATPEPATSSHTRTRPVEALRSGATAQESERTDVDAWLRTISGRR